MDLVCEERSSDSPFVDCIWKSHSEYAGPFISMAESQYSLVVTRYKGRRFATVRGPTTQAVPAYTPPEAEFFGIQFKTGVSMPALPASVVMERQDLGLPEASHDSFWLNGSAWQYPNYENADTFVQRLAHKGLLISDPVVEAVLKGQLVETSIRTVRRRFLRATGLTHGTLYQIERARYAAALLKRGVPTLKVVYEAGYFDQPPLTRSLKQFIGLTPAQVADVPNRRPLSFLYKNNPAWFAYNSIRDGSPSNISSLAGPKGFHLLHE